MAENRKKIVLEGQDAGVSSMMQRLKNDSKELSRGLLQDARQQKMSGKESIQYLEDQIRILERRNKLELEGNKITEEQRYSRKLAGATTQMGRDQAQTEYKGRLASISSDSRVDQAQLTILKDIAENIKEIAREETLTNPEGVQKAIRQAKRNNFAGLDEEEVAKIKYQEDLMRKEGGRGASVFSQFLGAQVLRDAGAIVQQMPNASSGLDLVTPVAGLAGMIGGAGIGAGAGFLAGSAQTGTGGTAAGRGALEGLAIGSELGKQIGQFAGAAMTRSLQEQEKYQTSAGSIRNITGINPQTARLARFGISAADGAQIQEGLSRTAGRAISREEMTNLIGVRGRGITQENASQYFGMERTGGGNASRELSRLIGVLEEIPSINRAIYNDIADSQLSLMQGMRATQDVVTGQDALSTILSFNAVGGQYGAKNPMSSQNIASARSSMVNPANDFVRARQMGLLKEANPDADYYDILEMMQSPTAETMELFLSDRGLSGNAKANNLSLANAYGGGNYQRGRSLSKFRALGATGSANMRGIAGDAARNTAAFSRQQASISDAYLDSPMEGVKQVGIEFGNTMNMIIDREMEKLNIENTVADKLSEAGDKLTGLLNTIFGVEEKMKLTPSQISQLKEAWLNNKGVRSAN